MREIDLRFVIRLPRSFGRNEYAMTTYPHKKGPIRARVWINFRRHYTEMEKRRRSFRWFVEEMNRSLDHELLHATVGEKKHCYEEYFARRFETVASQSRGGRSR